MTGQRLANPATHVRWEMAQEQAADLVEVLDLLEDFLRQANRQAIDELARFPLAHPLNPSAWADRLADYLGDQASALRAAIGHAAEPTPTGDLT